MLLRHKVGSEHKLLGNRVSGMLLRLSFAIQEEVKRAVVFVDYF
jgi:hypothetical protein